jgi:hypothetical protein
LAVQKRVEGLWRGRRNRFSMSFVGLQRRLGRRPELRRRHGVEAREGGRFAAAR